MSVLFETLESRQFLSVSMMSDAPPAPSAGPAIHVGAVATIRSGQFIGSASHSDGRVAVQLDMRLEQLKKGGASVLLRITDNHHHVDNVRATIDSNGAFSYTMREKTKTRVLTGGLTNDGNVFSGTWVETDLASGAVTTGTFRMVRTTPATKTTNYKGTATTSHQPAKVKFRLTHLDSGYLAEATLMGDQGIEYVYFLVAENGTFSFDKKDEDGGMSHLQGAFSSDFKSMAGQWSSTHNDSIESGTITAVLS